MKKLVVLIVDDSSVMRMIVERSLRQTGIEVEKVIEAGNGMDALNIMQRNAVDLVFSDINMPKMDGIEFLRQLHAADPARQVPILMVTTEGSEAKVLEALSLGAKGYIRKPFTPDQVREQVALALQS
ncbi:MAG: response regulator [Candidatus Dormibacteraceae bacterium]